MQRKFTVNGTFIPQDAAGNDMCILFMKYGRCRFKSKCKKSHWVPPLPDELYPVAESPPLPPDDDQINKQRKDVEKNIKASLSCNNQDLLEFPENFCQHSQSPNSTPVKTTEYKRNFLLPKRFKHVFHDDYNADNHIALSCGVKRLFNEAGAYFDNITQKLEIRHPPRNKIEKHRLKVLRRIHWKNTQALNEKLLQQPPSYNLKFDRSRINFTRIRPYVYVLVHECMCVDGEEKAARPSSFEYLIADTLLAYLEHKCITPQEAETKLQHWGARGVRARQCVAHLWHVLAISSRSPCGCLMEILRIEEDVVKGTRTSLDYACACAFALKRVKLQDKVTASSHVPRKVNASIKLGLEMKRHEKEKKQRAQGNIAHESVAFAHEKDENENASDELKHGLCNQVEKRRRRSRQFKNVPLNERKKFKRRCVELLSTS